MGACGHKFLSSVIGYWEGICGTQKTVIARTVPGRSFESKAKETSSQVVGYWEGNYGTKNRRKYGRIDVRQQGFSEGAL